MTRTITIASSLGALLGTLIAAAAPAAADDSRIGPSIGVGVGVARSSCEDTDCSGAGAGTLDLHLGMLFSARLGVMLDVWGMSDRGDDASVTHGIVTVGPRVWLLSSIWLGAGLGIGRARIEPVDVDVASRTSWDPAWVAAAGWELIQVDDFAFDVQLRASESSFSADKDRVSVIGLSLGANWY